MAPDSNLLEALARRVEGRIPPATWSRIFRFGEGAPVWTERKTLTLLVVEPALESDPQARRFEDELEWLAARHHGIRDRFAPGGAMVFFQRATDCVTMALALQREAMPLRLRIGITTASCQLANFCCDGEAFVTLLGAEAELASRVAASASTGSILISPSTYALVRDAVHEEARDCLLAEEYDAAYGSTACIMPTPARGGPEASTFAGLGAL